MSTLASSPADSASSAATPTDIWRFLYTGVTNEAAVYAIRANAKPAEIWNFLHDMNMEDVQSLLCMLINICRELDDSANASVAEKLLIRTNKSCADYSYSIRLGRAVNPPNMYWAKFALELSGRYEELKNPDISEDDKNAVNRRIEELQEHYNKYYSVLAHQLSYIGDNAPAYENFAINLTPKYIQQLAKIMRHVSHHVVLLIPIEEHVVLQTLWSCAEHVCRTLQGELLNPPNTRWVMRAMELSTVKRRLTNVSLSVEDRANLIDCKRHVEELFTYMYSDNIHEIKKTGV